MQPNSLDPDLIRYGSEYLSRIDAHLGWIYSHLGSPPLWDRPAGFPTLVHIILEQQVSLASALAAYTRLIQYLSPLTPEKFLKLDDLELKQLGFSRQKALYCRGLASAILNSELDLDMLSLVDETLARAALMKIKGIGQWTADIYLMMVLLRPDIWPSGDLALATTFQKLKQLPSRPSQSEMEQIAAAWRPWRAVAARLLWHYYLSPGYNSPTQRTQLNQQEQR